MGVIKPVMKITTEQWHAKKMRGLATVIHDCSYIVMTHESTHEPVYQPVTILNAETDR